MLTGLCWDDPLLKKVASPKVVPVAMPISATNSTPKVDRPDASSSETSSAGHGEASLSCTDLCEDPPVNTFLKELAVDPKELLTDEVEAQIEFINTLHQVAAEYILYATEKQHRDKYGIFTKPTSLLAKNIAIIDSNLEEMK